MKVSGVLGSWGPPIRRGRVGPMHEAPTEGIYTQESREPTQYSQSTVPCPYCHRPMWEGHTPMMRVKKVLDNFEMLSDPVPDTHRTLTCSPCKQVFTQPKETFALSE